jgi:hypothetical protein
MGWNSLGICRLLLCRGVGGTGRSVHDCMISGWARACWRQQARQAGFGGGIAAQCGWEELVSRLRSDPEHCRCSSGLQLWRRAVSMYSHQSHMRRDRCRPRRYQTQEIASVFTSTNQFSTRGTRGFCGLCLASTSCLGEVIDGGQSARLWPLRLTRAVDAGGKTESWFVASSHISAFCCACSGAPFPAANCESA